jgi:hypothetical protein
MGATPAYRYFSARLFEGSAQTAIAQRLRRAPQTRCGPTPAIFVKLRNTVDGPTSRAEVASSTGRKHELFQIKLHEIMDFSAGAGERVETVS